MSAARRRLHPRGANSLLLQAVKVERRRGSLQLVELGRAESALEEGASIAGPSILSLNDEVSSTPVRMVAASLVGPLHQAFQGKFSRKKDNFSAENKKT